MEKLNVQNQTDFDVLIDGAGISGIGDAYHLQQQSPGKSYCILEMKDTFGGTWENTNIPAFALTPTSTPSGTVLNLGQACRSPVLRPSLPTWARSLKRTTLVSIFVTGTELPNAVGPAQTTNGP